MKSKSLRPYQIEGVEQLLKFTAKRRAAILADAPGVGKTPTACEFINRTNPATVLVVCPASLRINWRKEISVWVESAETVIEVRSYEELTSGKQSLPQYSLAVFDEAHYLKNPAAKRTKACLSVLADTRLFLTGTPIVNRPMDIYPILKSCGVKISRTDYGKRYCNGHLKLVRWRPKRYAWDFTGSSREEELSRILRSNLMVRRTKDEVLTELPAKMRQVIELDIPDGEPVSLKQAVGRLFDAMETAAENLEELRKAAFTELASARLEIARNKLPYVIDFVKDLLEEEQKIVVFAHHREIVDAVVEAFPGAVKLYGGMTDAQKDEAVVRFQQDPSCRVFAGQIIAAGTGITLTAAHTVVFAELDWVPGNVIQAEDRCHRMGQKDSVRVLHLVAQGSVDARVVRVLVDKQNTIERLVK